MLYRVFGVLTVLLLSLGGIATADNNYGAGTYGGCQYGSCSLTISSNGSLNINVTPTSGGVCTIQSDSVSVLTDNSAGYTLTLGDTATSSALQAGAQTIAPASGSFATPAILGTNSWGYRIDGTGSFGSGPTSAQSNGSFSALTFAHVPNSSQGTDTIASTATAADPAVISTIWYGLCAYLSVIAGNYLVQITYIAVIN